MTWLLRGTTDSLELPDSIVQRLICHAMIQRLPAAILPDAIDSLTDDYETATGTKRPPRAFPGPTVRTVQARLGETIKVKLPSVINLD